MNLITLTNRKQVRDKRWIAFSGLLAWAEPPRTPIEIRLIPGDKRWIAFSGLLALLLVLALPIMVWGHPLGNFTVNRYSRLEVGAEQVHLTYILDMAEIPTHQERAQMDSNGDGQISQAEQDAYLASQVETLKSNLHLTIDAPVTLTLSDSQLEFPPGQANLPLLRLTAHFLAQLPALNRDRQAAYRDDNYVDRIGWQEVIVRAGPGVALLESSVSDQDVSQELRKYPIDLLQSPLAIHAATFRFTPQVAGQARSPTLQNITSPQVPVSNSPALAKSNDRFAELINLPILGPGALFLAFLAAFGWGTFHAFSPGHGKTIVGAYLVGSRGTLRHALFLGLTTTITHTAGVFAFGFVTLFASRYILPEKLFPWLSLLSGLLVVAIGLSLAWGRLRALKPMRQDPQFLLAQNHPGGSLLHSHGEGFSHRHAMLGANGAPVNWRNLFALGVSGGLLPCPSALVMMLAAIALQRVALGLVLIVIFSVGLASVLTGIGILLIHTGKLFQRIPESGRLFRIMPVASAIFITIIGVGISWQALVQTGLLGRG